MTNWDIARVLMDVKLLLLLKGKRNLASVYEKSAYSIAAMECPVENKEDIFFLPEAIKSDVEEILTGEVPSFKKDLESQLSKGLIMLSKLPYLSPENATMLYRTLGIDSISDLSRALRKHEIRDKSGFGTRFEEQVRKSLLLYNKENRELSLFEGFSYANSIRNLLLKKGLKHVEVAGSIRRGKEKVNNLNLVVSGHNTPDLIKNCLTYKKVEKENKFKLYLKDPHNVQIKFIIVPEKYFSSAFIYYTGSKLHNQKLKNIAMVKGFDISQEGYILVQGTSEKAVYEKLGLQYIPPEIREGEEEIELAKRNALPRLVEYSDIKGDLHIHSNFSDGTSSIDEIREEAIYHNYQYIAITDHSDSLKVANGLSKRRLLKEMNIVDKLNREGEITILKGSEIEINRKGELDFDDSFLQKLDVRLAAMHTGFDKTNTVNTMRLKKVLSNKYVNILAHPMGRLVSIRDGFSFNIGTVFDYARKNDIALEVNVFPKRMDLSVSLIKQAKRSGVQYFSVGTDSHNVGHLNFMRYGVKLLRRAYLTKEEVINTFELDELRGFLWAKRH